MSGGNVISMKGTKALPATAPKTDRSLMETRVLTLDAVEQLKKPRFQRELRITPRVKDAAELMKTTEAIEGVVTLGKFDGDTWLLDGQHRIEAFKLSGLREVLCDVRIKFFDSMADMAIEFRRLNTALVSMRTDDIMRAAEETNVQVKNLRTLCPFIGYDHIRTHDKARTLVSMATVVRVWFGSAGDTPTPGPGSTEAIEMLDEEQGILLAEFMTACFEAWGNDRANFKLWSTANLGVLMWLWRRVVLQIGLPPFRGGTRVIVMERKRFMTCMMALSADPTFSDWLVGRNLSERDRGPCYSRIKQIFVRRLATDNISNPRFPAGEWTSS